MNASDNGRVKQQIEAMYPVTGVQRGMVFHSLLSPGSGVYVLQDGLLLPADVDRDAFWGAWERVIQRHPVFRTLFVRLDTEQPVQVVLRDVTPPSVELDWSEFDDDARDAAFDALLKSEQEAGFDFAKAPLMRLQLIKRRDGAFYFVWTRHHVLLDGWSGPLVLRDVMQCYAALRSGAEPALTPARGYQDYVRWVNAQDASAARAYWTAQLQGFEERTPLPLIGEASGATRRVEDMQAHAVLAAPELQRALDAFVRRERVTLNCAMQAAWALLLSRYVGHREVTFGVTVSGRPPQLPGVEAIVGPFINSLPMTIAVDPAQRLGDWLRTLQHANSERAEFEFVPLVEIQSLAPTAERGSLFDSLLVFDNYPSIGGAVDDSALVAQPLTSFSYNNYPLTLMVMPGDESLLLQFKFDGARYSRPAVEQLLQHLQQLLAQMVDAADATVASLSLLSDAETQLLLANARGDVVVAPASDVVTRFEATVADDPQRIALVSGELVLTHAELDAAANRVARCLRAYGVTGDTRVALCCARNLRFVIGLLGILKAGASYVPIDGDWPQARIAGVLEASAATVIVTEQAMLERVAGNGDGEIPVVSLDRDWDEIAEFPADAPHVPIAPDQLAYLIFTSGSTGKPKGVGVSHASIIEYVDGVLPRLGIAGVGEFAALSTAAADLGHTALFGALCGGHALRLLGETLTLDAPALRDELARRPIDLLKIVPSHLEALLAGVPDAALLPRQCLVLGGESPSTQLLERVRALADCRIVNHYGPTEATVGVLTCDMSDTRVVAIGASMRNRSAYVLDDALRLLPPGAVGELHLGGAALARGYEGDARQTAERFIPDPFADAGQRMYRTGDRARVTLADGVQYLGRVDQQIKLRGHRIELGEIESVIRTMPGIVATAVALQTDEDGRVRLVAYVMGDADVGECATRATALLPEVMRPALWQRIEQLPLTANGKLDRRALPQVAARKASTAHTAPAAGLESRIAGVWAALLKRERVGRDDNFFELGGNSLLIIQAHGQLKRMLETELSVLDLFKYPTVAKLAAHLRTGVASPQSLADAGQRAEQLRQKQAARQKEA